MCCRRVSLFFFFFQAEDGIRDRLVTGVQTCALPIFPSILLTAIITIFIFLFYQTYSFIGIVGILLAFWIISNSVIILFRKKENLSNGMIIAHLGIGLLILGITGSSVWQEEKITQMKIGNETNIQEYNIILKEINEIKGPNYLALQGNFFVYDKNKNIIAKLKIGRAHV